MINKYNITKRNLPTSGIEKINFLPVLLFFHMYVCLPSTFKLSTNY